MKAILFLALAVCGCASTEIRDAAGKVRLKTQADFSRLEFHSSNGDSLIIENGNHSGPTLAGGNSAATIGDSAGRGLVGLFLAKYSPTTFGRIAGGTVAATPTKQATAPAVISTPFGVNRKH